MCDDNQSKIAAATKWLKFFRTPLIWVLNERDLLVEYLYIHYDKFQIQDSR